MVEVVFFRLFVITAFVAVSSTPQAHNLVPLMIIISLCPYAIYAGLTSFGLVANPNWFVYPLVNNVSISPLVITKTL